MATNGNGDDNTSSEITPGFLEKKRHWLGGMAWWDWLKLIFVPLSLSLIVLLFNSAENAREVSREEARDDAQATLQASLTGDAVLQSYLDDMTMLMLQAEFPSIEERPACKNLHTFTQTDDDPTLEPTPTVAPIETNIVTIGKSRTQAVFNQLQGNQLVSLLRFLSVAQLFELFLECNLVGIDLQDTDLSDIELTHLDMREANLQCADLRDADLQFTFLDFANLQGAILHDTNLVNTSLYAVALQGANLFGTNLLGADLEGADLQMANLFLVEVGESSIFPTGTILPDGTDWITETDTNRFTDPSDANFWRAEDSALPASEINSPKMICS